MQNIYVKPLNLDWSVKDKMERIGLFGGTFNPIHNGHIEIAKKAKVLLNLDRVIFIPAGYPYMKDQSEVASYGERLEMVKEAISNLNWADWSRVEEPVAKDNPTYTVNTIRYFRYINSDTKYFLILGEDAYDQLNTWNEYKEILESVNIVVASRGSDVVKEKYGYPTSFYWFFNKNTISSTEVRKNIRNNEEFEHLVPKSVAEYIITHKLYGCDDFNADKVKTEVVNWIRNKMNGFSLNSKAVIGISGGKDSSVVAALCTEALGKDRVYGVTMPDGDQADFDDSLRLIEYLGIHHVPLNIKAITNACRMECIFGMGNELTKDALINMPARIRMTMLYMVAQTLGNAFVINTCNLSEDWIGYSTWHGDSAGDFSPLAKLTSEEVVTIGDVCGLPYDLTRKTPSDGLCGQTDEDKLGFTYAVLNKYIRTGRIEDKEVKAKIDAMHKKNKFKLEPLDHFEYGVINVEEN